MERELEEERILEESSRGAVKKRRSALVDASASSGAGIRSSASLPIASSSSGGVGRVTRDELQADLELAERRARADVEYISYIASVVRERTVPFTQKMADTVRRVLDERAAYAIRSRTAAGRERLQEEQRLRQGQQHRVFAATATLDIGTAGGGDDGGASALMTESSTIVDVESDA